MTALYESLLTSIYSAVAQPQEWNNVLESLCDRLDLYGSTIFSIDEVEKELNTAYMNKSISNLYPRYVNEGFAKMEFGLSEALYQFKN